MQTTQYMKKSYFPVFLIALGCSTVCFAQGHSRIEREVIQTFKTYCAAVQSRDVNKALACYWKSPQFFMTINGKKSGYNDFAAHIKKEMPGLKSAHLYFDTLYVRTLGANYALATGPFHERTVDRNGKEEAFDVNLTWVLIRENNQYKLAYGTVTYQPIPPEQ